MLEEQIQDYLENSDNWEEYYGGYYFVPASKELTGVLAVRKDCYVPTVCLWSGLGMEDDYAYNLEIRSLGHLLRLEELFDPVYED